MGNSKDNIIIHRDDGRYGKGGEREQSVLKIVQKSRRKKLNFNLELTKFYTHLLIPFSDTGIWR
jgi:hypothetical protein